MTRGWPVEDQAFVHLVGEYQKVVFASDFGDTGEFGAGEDGSCRVVW